jgi:PAS domain S-box-containing protein
VAEPSKVLAGGGDLGRHIRALDWSKTPLGPVERWPRALNTAVRLMLTSHQPMWLGWGSELTYLYNDSCKSIIGGKHPWALGKPAAVVWREIWDDIGPLLGSALGGNEGTYVEAFPLIMERNGYQEETYYTFSYSPIPDDEGGVGGIFCANTDDTQRIMGERQLALLRELATRTAEARTVDDACTLSGAALDSNQRDLPFALMYLLDADHRRLVLAGSTANMPKGHPAAPEAVVMDQESIWPFLEAGRTAAAVAVPNLGTVYGDLPAGAWDRPPSRAVVLPIARSGETGRAGFLVAGLNPYRLLDDGYQRFLSLVSGQIAAALGNAQAYQEERRRTEVLAELDRAKTAFFSNVSHEFRTPLTLLLGPLEDALIEARNAPSEQRERLAVAQRNALRLLRMVNTLLDFSRMEAGRADASYESTDLPAYTAELASTFRSAVERAGLEFVVDCPPLADGIVAYVDAEMWEKIVLNLLSNAFKFTFAGQIGVSLEAAGKHIELQVRDTGTGIPAEELPRLFERFHRVQGADARTHEGTGIGLALVLELVKLHGGQVRVDSRVGQGTTFTVLIPAGSAHLAADRIGAPRSRSFTNLGAAPYVEEALRWLPAEVSASRRDPKPETRNPNPGTPQARVLLADDNRDMREYVARLLRERYLVEAVPDGEAALQVALRQPPDLVLSDVMMPRLDGFGLVQAMRADPRTREVPVILLSARAGEEARVEGLQSGADDYLIKPFSGQELLARVETHIQLTQIRREAGDRERSARREAERLAAEEQRLGQELEKQLATHVHLSAALRETAQQRDVALAAADTEQQRLRELFVQAPAIVAVLRGPEHVFELTNPKYMQVVGAHRDILGKPIREALPEVEGQGFFELLDRVYASGEAFTGAEMPVLLNRGDDGGPEEVFFTFVYQPLRDANGSVDSIFVHAVDVTSQVRARQQVEELAEHRTQFLALVENSVNFISMATLDGQMFYLNPAGGRLVGMEPRDVAGMGIVDCLPPGARHRFSEDAIPTAVSSGRWEAEAQLRHFQTGEPIDVDLVMYVVHRPNSDRPLCLAMIARDIRDGKRAEHLAAGQRNVLEMIARGDPLAPVLAAITRLMESHASPMLCSILLLDRDGIHLRHGAAPSLPDEYNQAIDGLAIGPQVGSCGTAAYRGERVIVEDIATDPLWTDFREVALASGLRACWSTPIRGRDGKVLGTFAMYHREPRRPSGGDESLVATLTYLAGIAIARHLAEEDRAELERQREGFLAAAAHDLKTPLTSIRGTVQLLQRQMSRLEMDGTQRVGQSLASVESATKKAASLIDELLDVARMDAAGALQITCKATDLVELTGRVVAELRLASRQHRVQLEADMPSLTGSWDAGRLDRAIGNLVGNAIKYSPNGGEVRLRIRQEDVEGQPWAVLSVQDSGLGIRKEDRERIFERFQRGSNVREHIAGSGIGLSYVREIVKQQGGTISVDSVEGQGSTFTMRLPLAAAEG